MTDLFGLGAFGASNPSPTRPAYTPDNGAGTPDSYCRDCSSPALEDGTSIPAAWANFIKATLRGLVRRNAIAESNTDDDILVRAVRAQRTNFFTAGGTANNLTISPTPTFAALSDLVGVPFRIYNGIGTNTGAMTLQVGALAAQPIVGMRGLALSAGDWPLYSVLQLVYNGSTFQSMTYLRSDALASPYLGFEGSPVSQSIPNNTLTRITNYTGIVNNLPGASHSSGIITIGTTGKYMVSANMLSLLPDIGSNYGASLAVSKVDAGGVAIASIAASPIECLTSSPGSSRATSSTSLTRLAAGDRIATFFTHNRGSSVNLSISIDIEFRGT